MTFQQLEYIVAVNKTRHFVNAATECGVTQSTLSATIAKLEQEIDVVIFDRSKKPIEPTPMGKAIIERAEIILHNSSELRDLAFNERNASRGKLLLGMLPSVASVIFPRFVGKVSELAPGLEVHTFSHQPMTLVNKLLCSELDMIITDNPNIADNNNILTIDLYTERFVVYASDTCPLATRESLRPEDLMSGDIHTLRSFHDHYPQLTEVTHQKTINRQITLDSGSLSTLVSVVDANGGFTILPETFGACLSPEQRQRMRRINSGKFFRTISLGIRSDYMRERMLNIVTDAVRHIIPSDMLDSRITKFDKVKL